MNNDDHNYDSDLRALKDEVARLVEAVSEMRKDMKQLVQFDKAISELIIHKNNSELNAATMWQKHDAMKKEQEMLRSDVDKAKGGITVIQVVLGIASTIALTFIMWTASNIVEHSTKISSIETRLNVGDIAKEKK